VEKLLDGYSFSYNLLHQSFLGKIYVVLVFVKLHFTYFDWQNSFLTIKCTLQQGEFNICVNCYNNGSCGENKSLDDFVFREGKGSSASHAAIWTEAETQLLLESISKHGNDWDLVAQNVKTKTKLDCILKLIELPFGEFMLGYSNGNGRDRNVDGNANNTSQVQSATSELPDENKTEKQSNDQTEMEQNQIHNVLDEGPPLKKTRVASLSDGGSSLMKQVLYFVICCFYGQTFL